jgi:hypothetical protein
VSAGTTRLLRHARGRLRERERPTLGRKRDELRAEALTDPKLAADLLEKANNRPGFVDLYKRSAGRAAAGNQDKRKGQ